MTLTTRFSLPIVVTACFLTGCTAFTTTPVPPTSIAPPAVSSPDQIRVVTRLATLCTASGLFNAAGGVLSLAVPLSQIPVALANAGVADICADPARYANDIVLLEQAVNLLQARVVARISTPVPTPAPAPALAQ